MNRTTSPNFRSTSPGALRDLGHLAPARSLGISPELIASSAVFALASVMLIGPLGVLLFVASTAATLATQPLFNLRQLVRFSPLFLFPTVAIISTVWSDAPERTMRNALELFLTFVAAIIIARNLRPHKFILTLFLAFAFLAITGLPDVPLSLTANVPLVSHFGSKNQTGLIGVMLFSLSLAVLFDSAQPGLIRLASLPFIPGAVLFMYLAQSGGTTSSMVLILITFPPMAILALMKLPVRLVLVALALLLLSVAALYMNEIAQAIDEFRTGVLNKDATLTGRTYLWEVAGRLSAVRPYLGYGYAAFWRWGNIDAEGLWRWGAIGSRSGFNFHNVFVETRVDLGIVGVVILGVTCAGIAVFALLRQISRPTIAFGALIGLLAVNYVRSYVEDGLVAPFNLLTLIWLATGIYAVTGERVPAPATVTSGGKDDRVGRPALRSLGGVDRRSTLFKRDKGR